MCRKNDQCSDISSFLIENKIDVKSDEISTFSSIKEVEILVSFLALKTDPKNKDHIKELLKYFAHASKNDEQYSFIQYNINNRSAVTLEMMSSKIFDSSVSLSYKLKF